MSRIFYSLMGKQEWRYIVGSGKSDVCVYPTPFLASCSSIRENSLHLLAFRENEEFPAIHMKRGKSDFYFIRNAHRIPDCPSVRKHLEELAKDSPLSAGLLPLLSGLGEGYKGTNEVSIRDLLLDVGGRFPFLFTRIASIAHKLKPFADLWHSHGFHEEAYAAWGYNSLFFGVQSHAVACYLNLRGKAKHLIAVTEQSTFDQLLRHTFEDIMRQIAELDVVLSDVVMNEEAYIRRVWLEELHEKINTGLLGGYVDRVDVESELKLIDERLILDADLYRALVPFVNKIKSLVEGDQESEVLLDDTEKGRLCGLQEEETPSSQ